MLSRLACVPRICLSCRLGLLQTRAALGGPTLYQPDRWIRHRSSKIKRTNLGPVVQSKERIEALISGRVPEKTEAEKAEEAKGAKGGKQKKGKKGAREKQSTRGRQIKGGSKGRGSSLRREEDVPDWGSALFFPGKDGKTLQKPALRRQSDQVDIDTRVPPAGEKVQDATTIITESAAAAAEETLEDGREAEKAEEAAIEDSPREEESIIKESETTTTTTTTTMTTRTPRKWEKRYSPNRPDPLIAKGLVKKQALGRKALGRPFDALVVKDPNVMRRPKLRPRELEAQKMARADIHWENLMPKYEEPDELMDEAVANIDELRPVDTTILRMDDFDALRAQLTEGFTYNQLMGYFHRQLQKMDTTKKQLARLAQMEVTRYDWVKEQTPWEPSQPDHWESSTSTPKANYVLNIVQLLWRIEVKEQVEGLGRIQLWLQPDVFDLIAGPSSSALRSLSSQYLYASNDERIETGADEGRLDIFARRSIVPVLLSRLNDVVSSITHETVSAEHLTEYDLQPSVLQEVARITSSVIRYDEEAQGLTVSWVASDGRTHSETPADVALRLLMGSQKEWGQPQTSTLQVLERHQQQQGKGTLTLTPTYRFLSHQRETRSMSWREKLQSWSRYVSPIGKAPASVEDAQDATDPLPATIFDEIQLPAPSAKSPVPHPQTAHAADVLTATFGHVLHKAGTSEQDMAQTPRIFSPVVAHPAALTSLTLAANNEDVHQQTSIVLNFAPSPAQSQTLKTKIKGEIPPVRLELPLDPDSDLSKFVIPENLSLHGIVPQATHDVLLPSESVDVRVQQQILLPLDVAKQKPLKEFLSACDFHIPEGRLRTPSRAALSVPASWVSPTSKAKRPVSVAYTFMGLEIHQVVELDWQGHTLVYESVDAGYGGRRQGLCLRAGVRARADPLDERERAEYLSIVRDLAAGKLLSWHEGYKAVKEVEASDSIVEAEEEPETDPQDLETELSPAADPSFLPEGQGVDEGDAVKQAEEHPGSQPDEAAKTSSIAEEDTQEKQSLESIENDDSEDVTKQDDVPAEADGQEAAAASEDEPIPETPLSRSD